MSEHTDDYYRQMLFGSDSPTSVPVERETSRTQPSSVDESTTKSRSLGHDSENCDKEITASWISVIEHSQILSTVAHFREYRLLEMNGEDKRIILQELHPLFPGERSSSDALLYLAWKHLSQLPSLNRTLQNLGNNLLFLYKNPPPQRSGYSVLADRISQHSATSETYQCLHARRYELSDSIEVFYQYLGLDDFANDSSQDIRTLLERLQPRLEQLFYWNQDSLSPALKFWRFTYQNDPLADSLSRAAQRVLFIDAHSTSTTEMAYLMQPLLTIFGQLSKIAKSPAKWKRVVRNIESALSGDNMSED